MGFTLPPIFQSPYMNGQLPKVCCCNPGVTVHVNVGNVGPELNSVVVDTRYAQASRIIAEANKTGFTVFQGM